MADEPARGRPSLDPAPETAHELAQLDELVRILRARCPWDQAQTHVSLGPHLIEEAYEALDAIQDLGCAEPDVPGEVVDHLREELGDVLIQVFLHSVLAEEEGRFTLADVAREIHDKMVRRHPHVFADAVAETPEDVAARWEVLKRDEKGEIGALGVTGGIPDAMPALTLSAKLIRKGESLGVDLPSVPDLRSRVVADLEQLVAAAGESAVGVSEQGAASSKGGGSVPRGEAVVAGELLLAVVDLARRAGIDPESALREEARRFREALESMEGTRAS